MAQDWSRYWRSPDRPIEAMHAHFERHVYHRHSHETYSFGVTETGAQSFTCRGSAHTSAAGMIMAFNPEDPHDGHATDALGFTYRIVHIGPGLVSGTLADVTGRRTGLPLFTEPVFDDPRLAGALRALHTALLSGAPSLRRDELLTTTITQLVRRAATRPVHPGAGRPARVARQARQVLHDRLLDDLTIDDLARATGASRYTVYRAFHAEYGLPPSDYQRQLRLRAARALIADGAPISEAATTTGFADQSHLTRWFTRYFGLTPGAYRQALRPDRTSPGRISLAPLGRK
ncbi:AraC family transcriptional regulator [Nonomuraea sp. KC401]|uniref:AraC family transcriptional regulator n=1 Tax=unclassified Nonomuraea TaxID=2593643 RepID=UPI0010FF0E94|nr:MULTISPECIES: AraC family transcriptional regulator [unclassified Nonomuraea]NBE96906.1 helix-turn-helix domain-containing protein [Nonomuraea sp. K271]TLF83305.1 AraC family transcriptional regulator [Nonomuraea sp. KC401]